MSDIVIKAENIGKLYKLGKFGTGSIAGDLSRLWAKVRGKEDHSTLVDGSQSSTEFWALRDINFEIKQGDAVGIIGKNGAGKSTLLKILSRITSPTTGHIRIRGRVASLLEVGTGFHPDLTGRENIFLNGSILGMNKKEIASKFDAIVDFSGVEKFIDTPVKRYSSGMYVRLAFAVAAHLEPEILIVDEVLAVGDAEFQKKCLGKMQEVGKEGRTVLFVSHNMTSIKALSNKAMFLEEGITNGLTDVLTAVEKYHFNKAITKEGHYITKNNPKNDKDAFLVEVKLLDKTENIKHDFRTYDPIILEVTWINKNRVPVIPNFQLKNKEGIIVMIASDAPVDFDGKKKLEMGSYKSRFMIPANLLNGNHYSLSVALDRGSPRLCYDALVDILDFTITDPMDERSVARGLLSSVREDAVLWPALDCTWEKISDKVE